MGSDTATCPVTPDPASLLGGLRAVTRPAVPCGPLASRIKKSLARLLVQLGPHIPNAREHVSEALDVRPIMDL
jgi:hypothetical protein